jgi:hypothetical protein
MTEHPVDYVDLELRVQEEERPRTPDPGRHEGMSFQEFIVDLYEIVSSRLSRLLRWVGLR